MHKRLSASFVVLFLVLLAAGPAFALFPSPNQFKNRPTLSQRAYAAGGSKLFHPRTDARTPACAEVKRTGMNMNWPLAVHFNGLVHHAKIVLPEFVLSETAFIVVMFLSMFLLGRCVQTRSWNANYTRKLLALVLLASPFCIASALPYGTNPLLTILSFLILLACLVLFAAPLRAKSHFLTIAFASIDRPEDQPHTLTWFVSAYVASSFVLFAMMWWAVPSFPAYFAIAFFAVSIGDLLAGAVGHRFGVHRYSTRALFGGQTYTRSWEGSACVFAVTLATVAIAGQSLPTGQFFAALCLLPIALTLAEAKSPHTWDEPIMFGTAMVLSMAIVTAWSAAAC